jgi:hypothetical protein
LSPDSEIPWNFHNFWTFERFSAILNEF